MTRWFSHGRLRIVLVFTQPCVVLLSSSSSGASTLTTVLGTESGCRLLYLKRMPNVCVRHLGLLGSSESSRLYLSLLSPSVTLLTLWNYPNPLRLLKCIRLPCCYQGFAQVSQHVTTSHPSWVTFCTNVTLRPRSSKQTPWHSGQRTVGTSSRTDSMKGGFKPLKDT